MEKLPEERLDWVKALYFEANDAVLTGAGVDREEEAAKVARGGSGPLWRISCCIAMNASATSGSKCVYVGLYFLHGPCLTVWAVGAESIPYIHHSEYTCGQRYLLAFQAES